jgi:hypothetical protein
MEDESLKAKMKSFKILDFFQYLAGTSFKPKSPTMKKLEQELEKTMFVIGPKYPYYKYFIEKENESKENLLLMHDSIRKKRTGIAIGAFIGYNIVKNILWRYGYFAYFFYHTRFMSFFFLVGTVYLINKNFEANLNNDDLLRYYEKRRRAVDVENSLYLETMKNQFIMEKMEEGNDSNKI